MPEHELSASLLNSIVLDREAAIAPQSCVTTLDLLSAALAPGTAAIQLWDNDGSRRPLKTFAWGWAAHCRYVRVVFSSTALRRNRDVTSADTRRLDRILAAPIGISKLTRSRSSYGRNVGGNGNQERATGASAYSVRTTTRAACRRSKTGNS